MALKIAFITDAWHPQINGVVTTIENTCKFIQEQGEEILVITPELFTPIRCAKI